MSSLLGMMFALTLDRNHRNKLVGFTEFVINKKQNHIKEVENIFDEKYKLVYLFFMIKLLICRKSRIKKAALRIEAN